MRINPAKTRKRARIHVAASEKSTSLECWRPRAHFYWKCLEPGNTPQVRRSIWSGLNPRDLPRLAAASDRGFLRPGPRGQEFFGTSDDAIYQTLRRQACRDRGLQRLGPRSRALPSGAGFCVDRDIERLQFLDDRLHSAFGIAEKFRAANAREDPAHAFENGLAVHVFLKPFERMIAVAVALDGKTLVIPLDHEIDAETPDLPLRGDVVAGAL